MKEYEEAYSEFIRSFELVSNERDKLDTLKEVFKAIAELGKRKCPKVLFKNLCTKFEIFAVSRPYI